MLPPTKAPSPLYRTLAVSSFLLRIFDPTRYGIELKDQQSGRIQLTRDLALLDLRANGAMRAGSVAALAKTANRNLSQSWSRYFYGMVT